MGDFLTLMARDGHEFSAYMAKAKTSLKIDIKQDVMTQIMGPAPAGAPMFPSPVPGQ